MSFDSTRPISPDNILWPSDMPVSLQHEAEARIAERGRLQSIRERIGRLERGEPDPYVNDGVYYGDVHFLIQILRHAGVF